ncbi:hypothetical protein BH160DRAFT_4919 [Burkholderia sp. H160]|nr:hypothetical protein BH160DRAFT_4919 [Burkholderia sp. H160]
MKSLQINGIVERLHETTLNELCHIALRKKNDLLIDRRFAD